MELLTSPPPSRPLCTSVSCPQTPRPWFWYFEKTAHSRGVSDICSPVQTGLSQKIWVLEFETLISVFKKFFSDVFHISYLDNMLSFLWKHRGQPCKSVLIHSLKYTHTILQHWDHSKHVAVLQARFFLRFNFITVYIIHTHTRMYTHAHSEGRLLVVVL